jgi:hypothetical protein
LTYYPFNYFYNNLSENDLIEIENRYDNPYNNTESESFTFPGDFTEITCPDFIPKNCEDVEVNWIKLECSDSKEYVNWYECNILKEDLNLDWLKENAECLDENNNVVEIVENKNECFGDGACALKSYNCPKYKYLNYTIEVKI